MNLSVKLYQDTRRIKADRTYPIVIRVVLNRKTIDFQSGHSLSSTEWNKKSKSITKKYKGNRTRLTNLLEQKKTDISNTILSIIEEEKITEPITAKKVKQLIQDHGKLVMTFDYIKSLIQSKTKLQKIGTAKYYEQILRSIKTYHCETLKSELDFPLKHIDYSWLQSYDEWYLSRNKKKNSVNGLAVYMRGIRAVINFARKEKLLEKDHDPFFYYSIKKKTTQKRVIKKEDLQKLKEIEVKSGWEQRAKDYFFASYALWGISFIDLAFLRLANIHDGRINYVRAKTGKEYSIGINEQLQKILQKYTEGKKEDEFVFGIIKSHESKEAQYRSAKNALKRFNKALSSLCKRADIQKISSYWSRHTFATNLKYQDVPTAIIKEMLGHESEKTTETYLASFKNETLDEYNKKVEI